MALIRNSKAGNLLRDAVVLDLGDISRQAEKLKAQAHAEAQAIIDQARKQAQASATTISAKAEEQGRAKGYAEGLEQGRADGASKAHEEMSQSIHQVLNAWSDALSSFAAEREELLLQARLDVLRLSLRIAERVVYRTIDVDPTIIEDQLAESLRLLSRRTAVSIHVNPKDLPTAQQVLPHLVDQISNCNDAVLRPDEHIEPGGCVVLGGTGEIDASIATQLNRIIEVLLPTALDDQSPLLADADQMAEQQAESPVQPTDAAPEPMDDPPPPDESEESSPPEEPGAS